MCPISAPPTTTAPKVVCALTILLAAREFSASKSEVRRATGLEFPMAATDRAKLTTLSFALTRGAHEKDVGESNNYRRVFSEEKGA